MCASNIQQQNNLSAIMKCCWTKGTPSCPCLPQWEHACISIRIFCVRSNYSVLTISCFNQVCRRQRPSETCCHSRGGWGSDRGWDLSGVFRGHSARPQTVAIFPSYRETYLSCHMHTSGYDREFNCACHYRLSQTMPSHTHAIHRGHLSRPLGVIARGHMARMTAWKHINQEGKLLNLCVGVRKKTLKNMGLLLV